MPVDFGNLFYAFQPPKQKGDALPKAPGGAKQNGYRIKSAPKTLETPKLKLPSTKMKIDVENEKQAIKNVEHDSRLQPVWNIPGVTDDNFSGSSKMPMACTQLIEQLRLSCNLKGGQQYTHKLLEWLTQCLSNIFNMMLMVFP